MAKDDYFVLVYKLLRYLYKCLKNEERPSWECIAPNTKDFPAGDQYFSYMLENLIKDEYIDGIVTVKRVGMPLQFRETSGIRITPKGIEYLQENSTMKKVADFLGSAGEIFSEVMQTI